MELWELTARERVRDNYAAYTHAGDRGRLDDLAAVFAEDGVLHVAGQEPAVGRQAIISMLTGAVERGSTPDDQGRRGLVRHFIANIRFEEMTRTEIHTAAYFLVVTGRGPDHWGRYRDRHVAVGDEWKIAHRYVRIDTVMPGATFAT